MMVSEHKLFHDSYVEGCFVCKLKTLQFGLVPGGFRAANSASYYDADSLPDLPSKEEVMDHRADFKRAPQKEYLLSPDGTMKPRS